jgi:hypothetical protein
VVSVLAIGLKVCGFNPGRERWIIKGDNNSQHTPSFRGEAKSSASYRKILWHVTSNCEQKCFEG